MTVWVALVLFCNPDLSECIGGRSKPFELASQCEREQPRFVLEYLMGMDPALAMMWSECVSLPGARPTAKARRVFLPIPPEKPQ